MPRGNYHPSFLPIADRIVERGMYSPWAVIEYDDRYYTHTHLIPLGDGDGGSSVVAEGASIEECATELVDAMMKCNEERHGGRGARHTQKALDEAYYTAIRQLQTRNYDTEHAHDLWLQMAHKKWGGPAPAMVLYPDQHGDWNMMTPDTNANPVVKSIDKNILGDIVPPPQETGATTDDQGVGWKTRRRWPAERKLKAMERRKTDA